jgi:hypothetical protein
MSRSLLSDLLQIWSYSVSNTRVSFFLLGGFSPSFSQLLGRRTSNCKWTSHTQVNQEVFTFLLTLDAKYVYFFTINFGSD